jgi:hypothetical protein
MVDKRTVFGAHPESIHQFLDDCLTVPPSEEEPNETARRARLLQEQLAEKGPASGSLVRSGSQLLDRIQEKALVALSRPMKELLSDDRISLDTLEDIKTCYKRWSEKASDKRMQRVYTVLYFAALARALVSHHRRITRHSNAYLVHSFEVLGGEPWMDPALRELFRKAQQVCAGSGPT